MRTQSAHLSTHLIAECFIFMRLCGLVLLSSPTGNVLRDCFPADLGGFQWQSLTSLQVCFVCGWLRHRGWSMKAAEPLLPKSLHLWVTRLTEVQSLRIKFLIYDPLKCLFEIMIILNRFFQMLNLPLLCCDAFKLYASYFCCHCIWRLSWKFFFPLQHSHEKSLEDNESLGPGCSRAAVVKKPNHRLLLLLLRLRTQASPSPVPPRRSHSPQVHPWCDGGASVSPFDWTINQHQNKKK